MLPSDITRAKRNFSYLFAADAVNKGLLFLTTVYLGRVLGIRNFGLLNYAQVLWLFFSMGADLGLEWFGVRELARLRGNRASREELSRFARDLISFRLVLGLLAAALYLGVAWIQPEARAHFGAFFFFALSVLCSTLILEWLFFGLERMEFVAVGRLLRSLAFCGAALGLVHKPEDLGRAAFSYWLGLVVSIAFLLVVFVRWCPRMPKFSLRPRFALETVRASLPIVFFSLLQQQVLYALSVVIVQLALGSVAVGAFSAVLKVISLAVQAGLFLTSSFFPLLARWSNTPESRRFSSELALRIFSVSFPVSIFAFVLCGPILRTLFGAEYAAQSSSVAALFLTLPLMLVAITYANALVAWGQQREVMRAISWAVLCNLGVGAGAAAVGSMRGVIAAILVSLLVMNVLLVRFGRLAFPLRAILGRTLAGLAATVAGALLLRALIDAWGLPSPAVATVVGLGMLGGSAFYLRVVHRVSLFNFAPAIDGG